MNKKEKKRVARQILKKHGYSDEEIDRILGYAFDGKRATNDRPDRGRQ